MYTAASRTFNPFTAAAVTIAEADEIVEPGNPNADRVDTSTLFFVDRVVTRNGATS